LHSTNLCNPPGIFISITIISIILGVLVFIFTFTAIFTFFCNVVVAILNLPVASSRVRRPGRPFVAVRHLSTATLPATSCSSCCLCQSHFLFVIFLFLFIFIYTLTTWLLIVFLSRSIAKTESVVIRLILAPSPTCEPELIVRLCLL